MIESQAEREVRCARTLELEVSLAVGAWNLKLKIQL
jgi:hypothetical protein